MTFRVWATAILIVLTVFYCALTDYFELYLPYTLLVFCLIQCLLHPRVSIFIKFLISLFLLGNWLKITVHGIFKHPYVEKTGSFSGTKDQWEMLFLFSIVTCFALLVAAVLSATAKRTQKKGPSNINQKMSTKAFAQIAILLIFTIYSLNWQFGFYRIGVARELNLPFGLDAPASFMVYLGAPMLTAILATNSVTLNSRVTSKALWGIAIVSVFAAIVTYSRATVAVLMLPIVLGMYRQSLEINGRPQSISGLVFVMVPTVIVTLASVSILRILTYGDATLISQESVELYFYESLGLFLDRWIGAEGFMVSVSTNQSTVELFLRMLFEDPTVGVQSIYQFLAGSQYFNIYLENLTFLTLPGAFAILTFSGSFLVVFFGVLLMALIGVSIEQYVVKAFRAQYSLQYLISGSLAYHFSQMIFPLLLIPFVVQLLLSLTLLRVVYSQSPVNTKNLNQGSIET